MELLLTGTDVSRITNHENDYDHPVVLKRQLLSTTVLLKTAMHIHSTLLRMLSWATPALHNILREYNFLLAFLTMKSTWVFHVS